jgi:hypothetical protein
LYTLGELKIYVAPVEAVRKNERQDETQFTTKIDGFLSFSPPLNANVLLNLTLCMTKLRVLVVLCFSYFRDNSNVSEGVPRHILMLPITHFGSCYAHLGGWGCNGALSVCGAAPKMCMGIIHIF